MQTMPFFVALAVGTALQIVMVVGGHYVKSIQNFYMWGGLAFSLLVGVIYTAVGSGAWALVLAGGAIAGALAGFIGIFISYLFGDVPAKLMLFGTLGSLGAGALGAILGRLW